MKAAQGGGGGLLNSAFIWVSTEDKVWFELRVFVLVSPSKKWNLDNPECLWGQILCSHLSMALQTQICTLIYE